MTEHASQQFEAGDFAAAEQAHRAILDNFPGDPVAGFMVQECMERQKR
jgi:TolA-binding protein